MNESFRIITEDTGFLSLLDDVDQLAATPVPILLEGESGTGKELIARRVHEGSDRSTGPFLPVNCAALCETLAESELFGHAAGSFTGALRDRKGLFEEAGGGTLFLDEIGDLSIAIQAKLLRVLQEGTVRRVGETTARPVDFRLVSATHKNLQVERDRRHFREDLYYRVNVVRVRLPPLRNRKGDVEVLIRWILPRLASLYGKEIRGIREGVLHLLSEHLWPGNVRELLNEMKRVVALAGPGGWIERHHLSESIRLGMGNESSAPSTLQERLDRIERKEILDSLDRAKGNKTRAAIALGLSRQGFKNKLARYLER